MNKAPSVQLCERRGSRKTLMIEVCLIKRQRGGNKEGGGEANYMRPPTKTNKRTNIKTAGKLSIANVSS